MNITLLRKELTDNHGLPADASDPQVHEAARKAMDQGKLTAKQVLALTRPPEDDPNASGKDRLPNVVQEPESVKLLGGAIGKGRMPSSSNGEPRVKDVEELFSGTKSRNVWPDTGKCKRDKSTDPYAAGNDAFMWEYDEKSNTTRQVPLYEPSELEYAKMGALVKFMTMRDNGVENTQRLLGTKFRMTETDQALVHKALEKDEWVGPGHDKNSHIIKSRRLNDQERDAFKRTGLYGGKGYSPGAMKGAVPILDDTSGASGGEQAVPQYFDLEAIRTPLLYSEVAKYVEITPTDRGKAAHSYSIGTPSYVSTASGSAITAFDATGFVSAFDVPFFPASVGIQWGRDFEMDAAPNFGQLLVAQLKDEFKYLMDYWVINGDGTTQPQGIKNASSTTAVLPTGTSHQTMVYNDGLNLAFGVTKPFRMAFDGGNTMFITSDKEYKKFMQLVTGVTGDTRPLYGMHVKDYQLGDYHVAIQNDIADGTVYFANLRGYRLYRRLGLYFELITSGQTLALSNLKLLFARARFGGKLTLGGYAAYMNNLQIG